MKRLSCPSVAAHVDARFERGARREQRKRPVHMFKKMFALASVTAITGLVATVAIAGCSSTNTVQDAADSAVPDAKKPQDGAVVTADSAPPAEEATVGKACTSAADCKVPDTVNDNVCSSGVFADGDLFGSPICIQPKCTQGSGGTIGDLLCDGEAGLCLPSGGGKSGTCFPFCAFDSTKVTSACTGGNKCNVAYLGTSSGAATAIGFCFGACTADADCKGTSGSKCQVEDGLCVNADKYVTFPKTLGQACSRPAGGGSSTDCNCNVVGKFSDGGTGPDADKGFCTRACVTGAAGDTACGAALAGWKCTGKLPLKDDKGAALFTAQAPDVSGTCALPCKVDADCASVVTSSSLTGLIKCMPYAGGSFCDATAP
jgi:hypothetical protein